MSDIEFKTIQSNGINLRLAMMGEGPLVIFCHGWPESWYSYRHQLPAVAKAGLPSILKTLQTTPVPEPADVIEIV